jgi:hypothetical protein
MWRSIWFKTADADLRPATPLPFTCHLDRIGELHKRVERTSTAA